MKNSIKTEGCDQYELTMMVSPLFYSLVDVILCLSSMVTETISTSFFPSSIRLFTAFLNHSLM
jgi:hypothetical protein